MTSSAGLVEGEEIAVPLPQAEAKPEQEVEPEEEEAQVPEGTRWYVVHTYSGYENKVKRNLDQRIRYLGVADQIFDIIVPTEEEIEIKEGQRRTVQRKIFPGYILVQMLLSDDTWHVVRHTPGVTGFVGPGSEPVSLPEHEVQAILKQMEAEAPKIRVEFTVGQAVRIVDGPFADFEGVVDEINQEKGKVRVLVSFFGRETPIELDFMQIERLVP
ncbi:MAG: transcription termination/antitermination protein NusG [Chloroflexia bacterium]|nr:transcription termination/antitermination protein NusG [Chloroflexia bacterium]